MEFPAFSVIRFGRLRFNDDSKKRLHDPTDEIGANASCYELEFYYTDCIGGLTVDGVHFPARKGFFTCCKPGQHRKMVLPYKCTFFNLTTQDPELQAALNKLPVYAPVDQIEQIHTLCTTMNAETQRSTLYGKLLVEGCVSTILSILFRNTYAISDVADHKVYRHQAALLAANNYLREHLQEKIDLPKLAHDSGLHPTYFHKLFTKAFGQTPTEQLLTHRVQAAMGLLVSEDLSISEIAERCGFSTPNYFCTRFREKIGVSPRQYRKAVRRKHIE